MNKKKGKLFYISRDIGIFALLINSIYLLFRMSNLVIVNSYI